MSATSINPSPLSTAWPRSAQLTTTFLAGALLALLGVNALGNWRVGKPSELDRGAVSAYRVDLNRAGRAELLQLPGVGPAMADRLEEYRRAHGGFQSADEVLHVEGIGPVTLERLRPLVYVAPSGSPVAPRQEPKRPGRKKADGLKDPINVNRASAEELQRLPRIGPKTAQRIIDERRKAPFRSVAELRRVGGIGPKTLELLRPFVTTNPPNQVVLNGDS